MKRFQVLLIISAIFSMGLTPGFASEKRGFAFAGHSMKMDMGQDFFNVHKYKPDRSESSSQSSQSAGNYAEILDEGVEFKMIWIPAGAFWMGMSNSRTSDQSSSWFYPNQGVQAFKYSASPLVPLKWENISGKNALTFETRNVRNSDVNWYETIVFCNRLSGEKGLKPCYYSDPNFKVPYTEADAAQNSPVFWMQTADGYRLPTDAEWSYANRILSSTTPELASTQKATESNATNAYANNTPEYAIDAANTVD